MVDIKTRLDKFRDCSTQTEINPTLEFRAQLSKNKFIKLYKSKVYSDYILTLNTNTSKKIVITKSMWNVFKSHINQIDGAFMVNNI